MDLTASASETAAALPSRVAAAFAAALVAGDAVGAAALFAPTGKLLTADGTEVIGRPAAEAVLRQLVLSEVRLEVLVGRTVEAGGVALATQYWRRSSPGRDGASFDRTTRATLVLGREAGLWSILIASPWVEPAQALYSSSSSASVAISPTVVSSASASRSRVV